MGLRLTRSLDLNEAAPHRGEGSLSINGDTEGIHHTAEGARANGDVHNLAGTIDEISLVDGAVVTKDNHSHVVGLQVEGHALDTRVKANELSGLDALEAIDAGDTVSNGEDASEMDDWWLVRLLPLLDGRAVG